MWKNKHTLENASVLQLYLPRTPSGGKNIYIYVCKQNKEGRKEFKDLRKGNLRHSKYYTRMKFESLLEWQL